MGVAVEELWKESSGMVVAAWLLRNWESAFLSSLSDFIKIGIWRGFNRDGWVGLQED